MKADEDPPPPWVGEQSYGEAVRRSYSLLSELTDPNSPAITLSQGRNGEWTLQPDVSERVLTVTVRRSWVALKAGRVALHDLVHAATARPMEVPDADPGFDAEELNPRTRLWP